jgi:hypothetical protein
MTATTTRLLRLATAAAATLIISAAPAFAATHYASPSGSASHWPCTSAASPCDLITAIQGTGNSAQPSPGDQVVIEPGNYLYTNTEISAPVAENISGAPGQSAPYIQDTITEPGPDNEPQTALTVGGDRLAYVKVAVINQEDPGDAEGNSAVKSRGGELFDDDVFSGTGPYSIAAYLTGDDKLKDSVASANGQGTGGIGVLIEGATDAILRNVTAAAVGAGADAIETVSDVCFTNPPAIVNVVNTIAYSQSGSSFVAAHSNPTLCAPGTLGVIYYQVGYSDFNPNSNSFSSGSGLVSDGGNINATPSFFNVLNDFRELKGSPTIDAGTNDPQDGLSDPDGRWRDLGTAPDMGAYEFPAPLPETDLATRVTTASGTLTGQIDDEAANLKGSYYFLYGPSPSSFNNSHYVPSPEGTFQASTTMPDVQGVSAVLGGLSPSTTYYYELIAQDADGTTAGSVESFTTAALGTHQLHVDFAGSGAGIVDVPGTDACDADCTLNVTSGNSYTLTVKPFAGSEFTGWSGDGCSGTSTCTVKMTADETVTATFGGTPPSTARLSVAFGGAGKGTVTVTGNPACTSACGFTLPTGHDYTLTAAPSPGSTFAGWAGGFCSGTGPCTVTLNGDISATATFDEAGAHVRPASIGRFSLSGVAKRKPKLSFTITAGSHALTKLLVTLPNDLEFGAIKHGLTVSAKSELKLEHGRLAITLSSPEQSVRVAIGGAALKIRRKAHRKHSLLVIATDTTGATTALAYRA